MKVSRITITGFHLFTEDFKREYFFINDEVAQFYFDRILKTFYPEIDFEYSKTNQYNISIAPKSENNRWSYNMKIEPYIFNVISHQNEIQDLYFFANNQPIN